MAARHTVTTFRLILAGLAVLFVPLAGLAADPPRFDLPVDCEIGKECSVQNYVDQDAGSGWRDFTCGSLSYDGHDGTDFRVRDYVDMASGVPVVAAAAGTVLRVRDGMDDVSIRDIGKEAVKDRMAGNAVVIGHGEDWESQYSHLRKGSVIVKPGDGVAAGQPIGLIGLSGNTEFPHVHFEVRHQRQPIDPFTGEQAGTACGQAAAPLWSEAALTVLAYRPSGLLNAGFAGEKPKGDRARHGSYAASSLPADSPLLAFWVDVFGVQAGDEESFRMVGPDGAELLATTRAVEGNLAQSFRFVGRKLKEAQWPAGIYRAEYRLVRTIDGAPTAVIEATRQVELH